MEYSTPYNIDIETLDSEKLKTYIGRVLQLGEAVRNVMSSFETAEFVEDKYGNEFKLGRNQKDDLTRIIRDICLGDLYIGNIVIETQKRLSVDQPKAQLIAANVVSHLLMPALEDIKKMESEKFTAPPAAAPTPAPAPVAPPPSPPVIAKAAVAEFDDDYVPPVIDLRNRG